MNHKGNKMTNKGVVFFFEGEHKAWFCTYLTYPDHGIRGFVPDGCWWMDYNTSTDTINVCIGRDGKVDWDNPINTFEAKMITHVGIPNTVEGSAFDMVKWARTELDKR